MLPRDERLCKNFEFDKVFKLRCSVSSSSIVAYVMLKSDLDKTNLPRVGFVVGKKINKRSTVRNKIKRRMRESYRLLRFNNPELVNKFESIIFIARSSIANKDYHGINDNILICLQRAQSFIDKKNA